MKTLSTVNVILQRDSVIEKLAAYPDTPEGNTVAEELFDEWIMRETNLEVTNAELDTALESGIFEHENVQIIICHSTI
jgi:hypothetical protein